MTIEEAIDRPQAIEQLTLAMGCFWGPEALFGQYTGVIQTTTGYAGGTTTNPVYRELGDHSECIELSFDPQILSLAQLLHVFWENHRPDAINGYKDRQYMSILFYRNEEQRNIMLQVQQDHLPLSASTEIVPYTSFTQAEQRHQKYYLQRKPELFAQSISIMSTQESLFQSTIGARLNALAKGHISWAAIEQELRSSTHLSTTSEQQHQIMKWIQQHA